MIFLIDQKEKTIVNMENVETVEIDENRIIAVTSNHRTIELAKYDGEIIGKKFEDFLTSLPSKSMYMFPTE